MSHNNAINLFESIELICHYSTSLRPSNLISIPLKGKFENQANSFKRPGVRFSCIKMFFFLYFNIYFH